MKELITANQRKRRGILAVAVNGMILIVACLFAAAIEHTYAASPNHDPAVTNDTQLIEDMRDLRVDVNDCPWMPSAGSQTDYELSWHKIAGGGGASAGGGLELAGTIGQHDAGVMTGGDYTLAGGFWAGGSIEPIPPCPPDLTGSGDVGLADLIELINNWGPCPDPGNCPADLAGSGDVGLADLIELINNWGPCP